MVQKTVFLSYRRTNIGYALAVYQALTARGFDVFFDYNSIHSGDFEQIILNNIESRAHFTVLLTPSALKRVNETGDWLRREIEYAIAMERNIVPLTMEQFSWADASEYLTGGLAPLKNYNALRVPADYFDAAMDRLCNERLNITLDAVIHPRSAIAQQATKKAQHEAQAQPKIKEKELSGIEYFEIGYEYAENDRHQEAIENFTKAIQLNSDDIHAYNQRGISHRKLGNYDQAMQDYNTAIQLDPEYAIAYCNRGNAYNYLGQYDKAILDLDKAIDLDPNYPNSYSNRGVTHNFLGQYRKAIQDYDRAIQINPYDATDYSNRANTYNYLGQYDKAIEDCNTAIRLDPSNAKAYNNRGVAYHLQKNYQEAKLDYEKAIELDPTYTDAHKNLKQIPIKSGGFLSNIFKRITQK